MYSNGHNDVHLEVPVIHAQLPTEAQLPTARGVASTHKHQKRAYHKPLWTLLSEKMSYKDSFVAAVQLRARQDDFDGKRVHIYSKKTGDGVGMMMKQGNQVLFDNVGIGQVEVMLPFGISAHFTKAGYKKKGININMWKCPMTEKHADEMDKFAQNLIDVGTELKNKAEKIKRTA